MRLEPLRVLILMTLLASPVAAATITTTVDVSKLGEGKNSVHYFESGGILYGFLHAGEFSNFALETKTARPVPMVSTGDAKTTDRAPAGSADKDCSQWTERCWDSSAVKITVCAARCSQRKDPETGETRPVSGEKNAYLTIASDVVQLH